MLDKLSRFYFSWHRGFGIFILYLQQKIEFGEDMFSQAIKSSLRMWSTVYIVFSIIFTGLIITEYMGLSPKKETDFFVYLIPFGGLLFINLYVFPYIQKYVDKTIELSKKIG